MKQSLALILASFVACTAQAGDGPPVLKESAGSERRNQVLPPVHTEKYEYYEVCGCCEKDLQCEMMDKAIRWKDGNRYDAITRWKVTWDYAYSRDDRACYTESFRVAVEIFFQLPKWICDGHAPRTLTEKWERYFGNLLLHEKGHRDKALKAAEDFTRDVAGMAPARSCSELDRNVQRLCSERMKQLDEEQGAYDRATGHGHVQGVSFP